MTDAQEAEALGLLQEMSLVTNDLIGYRPRRSGREAIELLQRAVDARRNMYLDRGSFRPFTGTFGPSDALNGMAREFSMDQMLNNRIRLIGGLVIETLLIDDFGGPEGETWRAEILEGIAYPHEVAF